MSGTLPLSALLSQIFVAFTIECDNEFEHLVPHRTTDYGPGSAGKGPWLVSTVMWWRLLQFVHDEGTPVRELMQLTHNDAKALRMWLERMSKWWGYVKVESGGSKRAADAIVRPSLGAQKALEVWPRLTEKIEKRWRERYGGGEIDLLREALGNIVNQIEVELPDCLPILGYGLVSGAEELGPRTSQTDVAALSLPALLAKVLLLFTLEFERVAELSLAIGANVLRFAGDAGSEVKEIPIKDLPRRAGVSREAIATAVSFLTKRGYAALKAKSSGGRGKVLVLKTKGQHARDEYFRLVIEIENRWQKRFGKSKIGALRKALERLCGDDSSASPLFRALEPYPDGWRAQVAKPEHLPHFPMILHRGGFPDGS